MYCSDFCSVNYEVSTKIWVLIKKIDKSMKRFIDLFHFFVKKLLYIVFFQEIGYNDNNVKIGEKEGESMIDLHMHTLYSDGDKSVEELLGLCQKAKLTGISITDHNTCRAYDMGLKRMRQYYTGNIIPGVELTANFKKRTIEILGYQVDVEGINAWCEERYSKEMLEKQIRKTYKKILQKLEEKGICYNKERISIERFHSEFIERPIYEEIITNLNNKKIIEKEFGNNFSNFYRKGLTNPNSSWFVDPAEDKPSVQEVIDLIHLVGGKAFLAHAFQYKMDNTMQMVQELVENTNLDGLECYYSYFSKEQTKELEEYAKSKKLLRSGGSDFHGEKRKEVCVGRGLGNLHIEDSIVKEWIGEWK